MEDDFYDTGDGEGDGRYQHDSRRICIYCDKRIQPYMVTCKEHYPWYVMYKDEQFQKELIENETKRKRHEENDWIAANRGADYTRKDQPVLTKSQVDEIYSLHDEGFGYKRIAKLMDIPVTTVAYYFSGKSKNHKSRYGHNERRQRIEQLMEGAELVPEEVE